MTTEDLYRLLRTGHVQLQGIVDTVPDPLLVLDGALCVQAASRAFYETFQVDRDETVGQRIYELGNGQWNIPELRRLLTEVIPNTAAVIDYRVEHEFPTLGRRTMLVTARTLHHPDRASHTMLVSIADDTERAGRDAARDVLFGELRHRAKNLHAVTQSIARQMPTEGVSAAAYRDAFLGRFAALIAAQDLAYSTKEDTGLKELLEGVFAPYDPAAVTIEEGPPVDLGPSRMMALSMALYELATNAAKYGALSVPGGRVRVGWRLEDDDSRLRLSWVESGGPPVSPPTTAGYGTRVVGAAIAYTLHGTLEQDYAAEGYRADIVLPLGSPAPSN